MKLNRFDSAINRENRAKLNENMSIIENNFSNMNIDIKGYKETVEENLRLVNQANLEASKAVILANAIQDELDSIVVEGDSSVEAAQARTNSDTGETYSSLRARLDNENKILTQQFAQTTLNFLNSVGVNVDNFGAVGDGITDDGPAIRDALNVLISKGGGAIYFTSGKSYATSLTTGKGGRLSAIELEDNIDVVFPGAIIKTLENENAVQYSLISSYNTSKNKIIGGLLIGNKETSTSTTGEWGFGVSMRGCKETLIEMVTCEKMWGDGFYIGVSDTTKYCENIILRNVVANNNRRQGLSLISCKNLIVENSKFINTEGTAPSDGIDIEPNNPDEFLENIYFKNVQTRNNGGSGIKFFLSNLDGTSHPVSITIENHKDISESGDSSFRIRKIKPGTKGFILAKNCLWNTKATRTFCHEESSSTGIAVIVEDCEFHYWGNTAATQFIYSVGNRFNSPSENPDDIAFSTVGNIKFVNPKIYSADGVLRNNIIFTRGYTGFEYDNFQLINPVILECGKSSGGELNAVYLDGVQKNVLIKDDNNLLVHSQSLSTVTATRTRTQKIIENLSTTTSRGIDISGYSVLAGYEFYLKIAAKDGSILINAENQIRGFPVGVSVKLNSTRDYHTIKMKVRSNGLFEILESTCDIIPV